MPLQQFSPPILRGTKVHEDLVIWSRDIVQELNRAFKELQQYSMSHTGSGRRSHATVAAGFTLTADGLILTLDSAGAVTSDVTTAIKDGQYGDWLIIINIGVNNITIKDNANTKLGGDKVLTASGTLMVVWNGSDWCVV